MELVDFPKDVIVYLALTLDLPEILSLCRTNSKFNNIVCENQSFWRNKLKKDYHVTDIPPIGPYTEYKNPKEYYEYITKHLQDTTIFLEGYDAGDVNLFRAGLDTGGPFDAAFLYGMRSGQLDIVKFLSKHPQFDKDKALKFYDNSYKYMEIIDYLKSLK